MTPRTLEWDDVSRLHELVSRWWTSIDPRAQMHIGDLYWFLRGTPDDDRLADTRVWPRADGSLAAFAWLDPPELGDAIVDPAADASLLDEGLSWIESASAARKRDSVSVVVIDGDERRVEGLRRRGYVRGDGGNTRLWRRLDSEIDRAPLPPGYSLGHVATEQDIGRRAFVESASLGGRVAADSWRLIMTRLPQYRAELDLIAIAPDGTGASACTVWYDEVTRCGELEAVGTAESHRRKGVGRAAIVEGLRRLQALGAAQAVVQTLISNAAAIALYQSCQFEVVGEDRAWVKRL